MFSSQSDCSNTKPFGDVYPSSTRVHSPTRNARKEYIVAKYAERRYVLRREDADPGRLHEAVRSHDLAALLQLYAEGADVSKPLTPPDGPVRIVATATFPRRPVNSYNRLTNLNSHRCLETRVLLRAKYRKNSVCVCVCVCVCVANKTFFLWNRCFRALHEYKSRDM